MKAVEKWTAVFRDRPLRVAGLQCGRERRDVARDQIGVEPDVPGSQEDLVGAHLLPKRVEGLVESFPRALLVGLRPEHADQPVAGHALLARSRQQGEQPEAPRLGGRAAQALTIALQEQPAKRVKT